MVAGLAERKAKLMKNLLPAALLLLLGLAARPGAAADLESQVHEYKLPNGLEILVYVDSSAPVVSTNVYYRVGSYDEPTGITGISHMLEHMTFQRTAMYRPGDYDRLVDSVGGRNNGFTSTFYTGYYEDFASDRWEYALRIEAARMASCDVRDEDFESEHQVVSEERRLGDNRPGSTLWEQFEATAFLASPQRNPTIGWSDDVARFTASAARDWYRRHYNPANAVLVVAGDVRPDRVLTLARQHFGKLKGRPVDRADYYGIEPEQYGERRIVVRRRVAVPSLSLGYRSPGIRDSAYYTAEVAAAVLGDGRSSRLYRRLVKELGLCTDAGAYNSVERDPGLLRIHATPRAESLMPAIEAIVAAEVKRMGDELITERELARVQNRVLANHVFERDDVSDIAYLLASSHIATGNWRNFKAFPERIRAVTREQVRDFCRAWLRPDQLTVGWLVSNKETK
jgi:zinc protease